MKSIKWVRFAWTGVVAILWSLLPWATDGTRFEWLAVPFLAPGFMVAAVVFRVSLHDSGWYILPLVGTLNFIFGWIVLFAIVKLIEKLIERKKREA
jgi:uncharacterized membrane protein HdeD (DUF308 family)